MIFAQETYEMIHEEIKPLIAKHYEEIAKYKDIPLDPDWSTYQAMESLGILKIFSCRLPATEEMGKGELVGYALYFVRKHLHYSSMLLAQQDILFIAKEHRGKGMVFIDWCDQRLKEMGCDVTMQHVKSTHNFGRMLERIGYELMDLIYTRRL